MLNKLSTVCWMCGAPADSGEHIFKARDLKRFFINDGYASENHPFHFSTAGTRRIPGPKSNRGKYPNIICRRCNNERTSSFDRAYDRLSDWLTAHQPDNAITQMHLTDVFGPDYGEDIKHLHRFFAKSLGCRIVAGGAALPTNFPNPISGNHLDLLNISVCRAELFRDIDGIDGKEYKSEMFERTLGKGDLFVTYSKSHFARTGVWLVNKAVWWENIGHFQINYWFNIRWNPVLGDPLDGTDAIYPIKHSGLGFASMKEAMWDWLSKR